MGFGVGNYEWWQYFVMPWMSGIVGWGTNAIALWMTFYPINFFGPELLRIKNQPWGLFGWQGIVPTKAEKIGSKTVDLVTSKLLNIREVFQKLDPTQFSESVSEGSLLMLDEVINEVFGQSFPKVWSKLPQDVKDEIVVMAYKEHPILLSNLMQDMKDNIEDVLDIKHMVVTEIVAKKHLLGNIFLEIGDKEFTFIRHSGFYFGFLFGVIQTIIWLFYNAGWVLPVFGFVVGWCTNYIALKIIFSPINPIHFRGYTFHGLFLKRQQDVAKTFARINCVEILHVKAMWDAILTGPKSKNFYAMLRAHTIVFVEQMLQGMKPLLVLHLGASEFAMMKEEIASKVIEKIPSVIDESYEYTTRALNVEETICERMAALTSEEFEGVLHPAFEEDEILLIIVGGVLGMIVGFIQLYSLFV